MRVKESIKSECDIVIVSIESLKFNFTINKDCYLKMKTCIQKKIIEKLNI